MVRRRERIRGLTMHEKEMAIADAYDRMPHDPNNCFVKAAYKSFCRQTVRQWHCMHWGTFGKAINARPWDLEGQPYDDSAQMFMHLDRGNSLFFFTGGTLPSDHPLAAQSGIRRNGVDLTYNDIFRAVHDYFGHYLTRSSFGPKGEERAYQNHLTYYTGLARLALQTETQGQNSWFNYGRHLRIGLELPEVGARWY